MNKVDKFFLILAIIGAAYGAISLNPVTFTLNIIIILFWVWMAKVEIDNKHRKD